MIEILITKVSVDYAGSGVRVRVVRGGERPG